MVIYIDLEQVKIFTQMIQEDDPKIIQDFKSNITSIWKYIV